MIKMIFSYMDGTLLDENGQLPGEFAEVMERLLARGVRFAPPRASTGGVRGVR